MTGIYTNRLSRPNAGELPQRLLGCNRVCSGGWQLRFHQTVTKDFDGPEEDDAFLDAGRVCSCGFPGVLGRDGDLVVVGFTTVVA